ncbi:MAG: ACT domain-containing protein, partial [Desulfofustis sp.]|nr:ACT domain-containing protein [Desulfofustis sp.]
LINELKSTFELIRTHKVAIVCAIGSNIAQPGIMATAARALAQEKINIMAVSQTTRQTNMQFIVDRAEFANAQRALHAALCM